MNELIAFLNKKTNSQYQDAFGQILDHWNHLGKEVEQLREERDQLAFALQLSMLAIGTAKEAIRELSLDADRLDHLEKTRRIKVLPGQTIREALDKDMGK